MKRKQMALWALVLFLGLLGFGTINNQLRINDANAKLAAQAANGQKALNRTCELLPISLKIYTDNLKRGVISAEDFATVTGTAAKACPNARP